MKCPGQEKALTKRYYSTKNHILSSVLVGGNPYPIGSIYMSINSTNPTNLFGGTWEQLQNRFLLGAGSSYNAGATGGESTHTLTTAQIPSHNHTPSNTNYKFVCAESGMDLSMSDGHKFQAEGSYKYMYSSTKKGVAELNTANTGSGGAHNNMPPYLVVYMWKRTG